MSWTDISEAHKRIIHTLIKSSSLKKTEMKNKNPKASMTRSLYTDLRREDLQDKPSECWVWAHNLNYSISFVSCQQLFLPKHLSFSASWELLTVFFHLSWPSVFWLDFPFLCTSADCFCSHIQEGCLQGLSRDNKHSVTISPLALDIRAAATLWIWNFQNPGLPICSLLFRSPQVQVTHRQNYYFLNCKGHDNIYIFF